MEEYIVSARKYRPATFDTVIGQRALTTTLLNAIRTGKLAHAYLFCGPRGVGKTTCARIFAKTINCLSPRENGEACNECESCRSFDRQTSMNIHELDAASNNGVDNMRELTEQVRIPPQGGKYKVFIIDEVHMLSAQAFNAFLKTLEEPPKYVIFILATTEKNKVLPTILSRCQIYDFARMSVQNTVDHLAYVAEKEGYTVEPEALNLIAQKADGGMRDALSIFDQMVSYTGGNITYQSTLENLNVLDSEYYFRLVDHFLAGEVEPCLLLFNEVLNRGFDGGNFIEGLASHARDLLVSRDAQTLPLLEVSDAMRGKYQEQAQRCKPEFLYKILKLCNDCGNNYRQSRNKRLQVELCLIQAAQATDEDAPASGLRPDKSIKPIFKAADKAAQGEKKASPSPADVKKTPATAAATAAPPAKKPTGSPKRQPVKRAMVDPSAVSMNPNSAYTKSDEQRNDPQDASFYLSESGKLTDNNLIKCWHHYANTLETDDPGMANRLRGIVPSLQSEDAFSVTVGSDNIKKELESHKSNIEAFFSRHASVPNVEMHIVVNKDKEAHKVLSKPQLLKRMMERNHALEQLVNEMDLEID